MKGVIALALGFVVLAIPPPALAQPDPYDYYSLPVEGGTSPGATGKTHKVLVSVGNRGPNSGPNYDIILTVKKASGEKVCETGYSTRPPMAKNTSLLPLSFEVFYANPTLGEVGPRAAKPEAPGLKGAPQIQGKVNYVVETNLTTQYPNQDQNGQNNFASKTFSFNPGGTPKCHKLLGD